MTVHGIPLSRPTFEGPSLHYRPRKVYICKRLQDSSSLSAVPFPPQPFSLRRLNFSFYSTPCIGPLLHSLVSSSSRFHPPFACKSSFQNDYAIPSIPTVPSESLSDATSVSVDSNFAADATLFLIRAPNKTSLLQVITRLFKVLSLRIVRANVEMDGDFFFSNFFVTDSEGKKIEGRDDFKRIKKALSEAISCYSGVVSTSAMPLMDAFLKNGTINLQKLILDRVEYTVARSRFRFDDLEVYQKRNDRYYMRKCVDLARKAIGYTSPNPMVGCVIVRDGTVVGEGFHPKAGQPHAEVFALRNAKDLAENATAYVSLEPCNHYGRTPPCTEALVRSKVKRVVVGMVDPNPIVASKGVERLRDAGIEVTVGVEEELCNELNETYIHRMLTGNPFVALRYSVSVNGCLMDQLGDGVTASGGYFSKLLKEYDAVIFSPSSPVNKYSFLASQEPVANQPLQILVAKKMCPPIQTSAFGEEETSKLIIFSDNHGTVDPEISKTGIKNIVLEQISLRTMLEYCKGMGLCSVLIDLRGNFSVLEEILREGIEQNLVPKIIMEILPIWDDSEKHEIGMALPCLGRRQLEELVAWNTEICGKSIVIEGYL